MTTDSIIQALRRLIARKGNVRQIHSDNGPNFVGAEQELINAFNKMDHTKIQGFFRTTVQIRSNGKETHQQQATWMVYWSAKFIQPEVY